MKERESEEYRNERARDRESGERKRCKTSEIVNETCKQDIQGKVTHGSRKNQLRKQIKCVTQQNPC